MQKCTRGDARKVLRQVVWLDGHSDYGHALQGLWDRYGAEVTPKTTVIITGDARNNYRPAGEDVVRSLQSRARALYWLNPEPVAYWDTGDSVMSRYAPYCRGVFEVRNLRQLEQFVSQLASSRSPILGSLTGLAEVKSVVRNADS